MKKTLALASLVGIFSLAACGRSSNEPSTPQRVEAVPQNSAPAAAPAQQQAAQPASANLLSPGSLTEKAPDVYKVKFATTKGDFVVEVHRDWAPNGADRFYNLVKNGFYNDDAFFRVVKGFMVQFGVTGDPKVNAAWIQAAIPDDPVKQSNKPGMITFATAGPNTRTTQVFINYNDNGNLDSQGFAPFGYVSSGFDVVQALNGEYGDGAPFGKGPDQNRIQSEGNSYLKRDFANLDYIKTAMIAP